MLIRLIVGELHTERLVAQVFHLIDFSAVHIEFKEIVEVVAQQVVIVVGEHKLLCDVGANIVEFHPKHRPLLRHAIFIFAMEHRTNGIHPATHFIATGVEFPFFDDIVAQHLAARDIGILNHIFRSLFGAPFGVSIENVEAVEQVGNLILVGIGKHFASVEPFIHIDFAISHSAHDNVEEALTIFVRLFGIVERGIFALGEV